MAYSQFELNNTASDAAVDRARQVLQKANAALQQEATTSSEERLVLLESWMQFEVGHLKREMTKFCRNRTARPNRSAASRRRCRDE